MIKLFTHNDLDGVGCAILSNLLFGEDVDITYCDYNTINIEVKKFIDNKELSTDSICFITDISISEELAEEIDSNEDLFARLYDHHATALHLNKFEWCTVKTASEDNILTCGTELFFKAHPKCFCKMATQDAVQRFVECVRNYDTWRWSKLGEEGLISKQLNDLLYILGTDKFVKWALELVHKDVAEPMFEEKEYALLENRQNDIDRYVDKKNKTMAKIDLCEYHIGIVFADNYISELGNKLCEMNNDIDFVAIFDLSNNKVSYRTIKEDINLGVFAKKYGGGGHPKAAGSPINKEIVSNFVKNLYF